MATSNFQPLAVLLQNTASSKSRASSPSIVTNVSGDVIYIPAIGAMAAISGSVNTPAIFELKGDDSLAELINLAGGLTNVASGKKVTVERIHDRQVRKVDEFQLDKIGLTKLMRDGDLVKVLAISAEFDNAITLRGNIAGSQAGRKPWKAACALRTSFQIEQL